MMRNAFVPIFLAAAIAASDAWAHPGHFPVATFALGLEHPWLGVDHALAAIAVGLWASAHHAGRRWPGPVLFVASMLVGAFAGHAFGAPAFVDLGIAGSVVLLGALLLGRDRVSDACALSAIAGFAILHGLAHGGEAPAAGSWPAYATGLATGTMLLHLLGIGLGMLIRERAARLWPLAAIAVIAAGAWMFAA
jgi:urease accessory protein